MVITDIIDKAKKNFVDTVGKQHSMNIHFLLYELFKENDFTSFMEDFFEYYNDKEIVSTIKEGLYKHVSGFKLYLDSQTEERQKEILSQDTKEYNKFVLFLLTQLKLLSKDEQFLGILITLEQFTDYSMVGMILKNKKLNRDSIIEYGQYCKIKELTKASSSETKDLINNIKEKIHQKADSEDSEIDELNKAAEDLGHFFLDMNEELKHKKTNKLIGYNHYLEKIEQSLFRKNKSGVMLVGKSGVGKDEIVNGFIKNIKNSHFFKNFHIIKINTNALSEVNVFRGHLESKCREIVDFLSQFEDVIIYIEDIHNLFNKIRVDEDIAHVLLPQLIKRNMRVIATCSYEEWSSSLEDNTQIVKYFHKIDVSEPSAEETFEIVKKNLNLFEKYYDIKYDKSTARIITSLADKYVFNKCFPEKAFDIIDLISAKFKYDSSDLKILDEKSLVDIFGKLYNIPVENIKNDELLDIEKISKNLKNIIISQDEAIDTVLQHIAISKAGLREDNKTICNIFLKAQSGVGKTYFCQELANALNIKLIRFDMSEYSEQHSVAKFLGTPPGYVGFNDANHGSLLISALEQYPRCVLLLDEIEKANKTIHDVLLQAMDNGKITSSTGKEVSLKNVILIMTSNVGATASDSISFGESIKDNAMEHMDEIFKPEFKTRLDNIITMNPVSKIDVKKVIDIELNKINPMIKKYKKKITWSKEVVENIEKQVKENNLGLRIIKHIIDSDIKIQIVKKLNQNGNLKICVQDGKLKVI